MTQLWTNDTYSWMDDYREEYPDASEDELLQIIEDINNDDLDILKKELDIELPGRIYCFGKIGRWNGIAQGFHQLGRNISECFRAHQDDIYYGWDVDGEDLVGHSSHHDGSNSYLYRMLTPDIPYDEFEEKYLESSSSELNDVIQKFTRPIGCIINQRLALNC